MSEITYHKNKLAINVKDYHVYARNPTFTDYVDDPNFEMVYDQCIEAFWRYAHDVADEFGYGDIESEGRSGGWLVVENPPELDDDSENPCDKCGFAISNHICGNRSVCEDCGYEQESHVSERRELWLEFQSRIEIEVDSCREDIILILDELRAESRHEEQEKRSMEYRDIPTV